VETIAKPRWKIIPAKEHMPRLIEPPNKAKVGVIESQRYWNVTGTPLQFCALVLHGAVL